MATVTANIHLRDGDKIVVEAGEKYRWIKLGDSYGQGPSLFGSDAQFVELRNAIDAYLANSFTKPAEVVS